MISDLDGVEYTDKLRSKMVWNIENGEPLPANEQTGLLSKIV